MAGVEPSDAARADPRHRRPRRTVGQRLTIVWSLLATIACFAVAAGLALGQYYVSQQQVIDTENPAHASGEGGRGGQDGQNPSSGSGGDGSTPETLPVADPEAKNFLITGADNGSCVDPDSPFAPAFGDRSTSGERSDTIMLWRVDPRANRAAVLSLPRDLWVEIPGAGSQRINGAYRRTDPQLLIDTIYHNFGIGVDHWMQADFCAFKLIVDAVGGVPVPFKYPVRDTHTGLNVPEPGCFTFNGDHALAYVRSRYLEYLPPDADPSLGDEAWEMDPTFDLGRISRQQDFLRRMLAKVLDKGLLNPSVVRGLFNATRDYLIRDDQLSLQKLLEFAGVLQAIDPDGIPSYQLATTPATISGNAVLLPELDTGAMPEILALFRGERSLQKLPGPAQPQAPTGTTAPSGDAPIATVPAGDTSSGDQPGGVPSSPIAVPDVDTTVAGTTEAEPSTPSTVAPPQAAPEDTTFGIVPDESTRCTPG